MFHLMFWRLYWANVGSILLRNLNITHTMEGMFWSIFTEATGTHSLSYSLYISVLFCVYCKNKIKRKKSQRCKLNPFSKTIFLESLDNQEYRSEHWKRSEWCRHIFSATLSYLPYDQSVFGLTKKWQAKGNEDVMELRCLRRKLNKSYKMFTLSDQT